MKKLTVLVVMALIVIGASSCDPTGYEKNNKPTVEESPVYAVEKDKLIIPEEKDGGTTTGD